MEWRDAQLPTFTPEHYRIVDHPVRNFSPRQPPGVAIDAIVIHDTATLDVASVLATFDNLAEQRSAHFVIDRDGTTYQLVAPRFKAWHAGESALWGRADVNEFSIGIELVDVDEPAAGTHRQGPHETTLGYTDAQLTACLALCVSLVMTYPGITVNRIVGHEHVALPPGRKVDPGPDFPWREFLEAVGWHVLTDTPLARRPA
jgi:N-acetylmuramoyl-L-alanine amidase